MTDKTAERRFGTKIELRAAEGAETVGVSGYAAVFGAPTMIGDFFEEVIAPGAFSEALKRGDDTVFLIDHEGLPLARTTSGTLKLTEDDRGLKVETDLATDDPDVMRVVPKMRRGDLSKMSFAFRATREEWDETGDIPRRTIFEVELVDVAVVTFPAYPTTEIGLRRLEEARSTTSTTAAKEIAAAMHRRARLSGL